MPTPATPPPVAAAARKIVLAAGWNSASGGGEMTRKDLATVFSGKGKASDSPDADPAIIVYPEVPLLTPLAEAKKRLKLEGANVAKIKVTCPGLPAGSLSAQAFTGVFEGGYNKLILVTDNGDQVVSVQLVDETPRQRTPEITDLAGYHTYNFISSRVKGANSLVIKHEVADAAPGVVVVDSALVDPTDNDDSRAGGKPAGKGFTRTPSRGPRTGKVLERSRWFVPVPLLNLILRCVGTR